MKFRTLNETKNFKYKSLDFTVKFDEDDMTLQLKFRSGPLTCTIDADYESGTIDIDISNYAEWYDTKYLRDLNSLMDEISEDEAFRHDALYGLVGV